MGLEKKDTMTRAKWRVGVREIAAGVNPATHIYGDIGLMMTNTIFYGSISCGMVHGLFMFDASKYYQ